MLQLILGTPGTGKTYTIFERLAAATTDSSREGGCLLLVPEQFSFESERHLLHRVGAAAAQTVNVYSFTRLAEMILRQTGHFAGRRMDDGTRALLVSEALSQTESVRSVPRHGADSGQVSVVAQMLTELKRCALTADDVRAQAQRETGRLREKLTDLSVIAEAYDALVEQAYVDPQDTLTRAAEHLPESTFGVGAQIFVDGFTGFTAQELNLLQGLMSRAEEVTVALCTDSLQETESFSLFAIPTETAHQLTRMAQEQSIGVRPAIYLTDQHRYRSESLQTLATELFRPDGEPYPDPAPEVTVTACADVYGECEMVTRTIRRLLREGGRCRDIAIVARDLAPYRGLLDVSLNRAGIPNYFDVGDDVLTDSLTETVLAAIRTVTEGWQIEHLLRLLKTGLLGYSTRSVSALEDYVYLWNLSGASFRREWTKSPSGFSDRREETDEQKLFYLNVLRHRLATPLGRLHDKIKEPLSAREFAEAVYDYLRDVSAERLTRLRVRQFDAAGETALADRTERVWDVMMELLGVFGDVGPATRRSAKELSRLFQMMAGQLRLGSIPQSLDAVQIGAADRIRMSAPKVVFVLGANDGVFPGVPPTGGYFTAQEREQLLSEKMPLSEGIEWQSNQEQYFAYAAVTAPSDRLYVSYWNGDVSGKPKLPSSLVYAIESLLPGCTRADDRSPDGCDVETPEEAMDRLASVYRRPSELSATLAEALRRQPAYAGKMEALRRAADRAPWKIHDEETARRLFGDRMTISYTAVDEYYACPFKYFCRYGLRVSAPRRAELNALEFGVAVHFLMEQVLPLYIRQGVETVTREQTRQDAAAWVDRYVAERMGGAEEMPARFTYLVSRLKVLAQRLLWFVVQEQRQSRFTPIAYELTIDEPGKGDVRPLVLSLPDGTQISVTGKIDRVDTYQQDGHTFLRILDYKTGSKSFRLEEVVEGLNLQMFIYLFTLCHGDPARYGNATPAGVLYLPAKFPVVKASDITPDKSGKETLEETRERKQLKAMTMEGILINDPDVLAAMEEGGGGVFIPTYAKQKGADKHVATLEQFGRLKRRMEDLLTQMATSLRAGGVEANPFVTKNRDACEYCDYRDVCGREDGDPTRTETIGLSDQIMQAEPGHPSEK